MSDNEHNHGGSGANSRTGGMAGRGVARPGMEREGAMGPTGHPPEPYSDERRRMLERHHGQTLWIYWLLVLLGIWLVAAPFAFGYLNEALWVAPSGGRGVWFGDALHTEIRARLMMWSDVASGLLLVVFGWRSLTPGRAVSRWAAAFVGIWLSFAPVLFWAPTAAAYLNDTLVGMLAIALAVLIPGMPNMILYMKMGPPVPPGWSYTPSSWPQRWIMIALAFLGFLASRWLAAYQLGYLETTGDPFFGAGTQRVLDSDLSHLWPISDAALGTFAYTFEFLMGWMGGAARWRTMPWMVTFFGILVIPLGLVHIALVISQPVVVGSWCTACLLAAAIMLPMIPLEGDEVIAMGQHVLRAMRRGTSLREAFWKGGAAEGSETDERTPDLARLPEEPRAVLAASIWGMSFPWTLLLSTALGVWLMFAPWALGLEGALERLHHVGGALVVVASVIAMGEVFRSARLLNAALGLVIALGPWVLAGGGAPARIAGLAVGLGLAALALPRGPKRERYGTWDVLMF